MTKRNLARRVTVWWDDSHGGTSAFGDDDVPDLHKPLVFGTTGWVVRQDKAGITLCSDLALPDQGGRYPPYKAASFIPAGCIRRIERLRPK